MSMQIKQIVLYNSEGQKRIIKFKLNAVNIITGESKTGKSSIINIIDYCLGRSTFQVAAGVIQDTVEWYAVIYTLNDIEIMIAKPKPAIGYTSSSEVYLEIASKITLPELQDLLPNSNDKAVIDELNRRIGISPNLNVPPDGQTREPLEANLRHAKHYLFQPQGVIANKEVLFYRQSEPFLAQSIKDTILYFLGVVQEERLRLVNKLVDLRRESRKLKKDLQEIESYAVERKNRAYSLLAEAKQVGLVESEMLPTNLTDAIEILTPLKSWQPTVVPSIPNDLLAGYMNDLQSARSKFKELSFTIEEAEAFVNSANGYFHEAVEQVDRLESINLFNDSEDSNICPLCGNTHDESLPSTYAINRSLHKLHEELHIVTQERPELDTHISKLKNELESTRVQIEQLELDVRSLVEEQAIAEDYQDTNSRIAHVIGRISYYLDVTPMTDDETTQIRNQIEALQSIIDDVESKLDSTNIEDRTASILNIIGNEMTRLSKILGLEHDAPYRLDLKKLTVVADKPDKPIIMNQDMGSAANHLGSHLITLLALHRHFINQNRPVPSFLVLDQPTQVYFPPEVYENRGQDEFEDEDRVAVEKIFTLLFEVSHELGLQIIVLDHANLDNEDFQNAIIDNGTTWRDGNALIPYNWL